jgi:hypothetical protein
MVLLATAVFVPINGYVLDLTGDKAFDLAKAPS